MTPKRSLPGDVTDPRMVAAIDLIGRTGATHFSLRYSDDETPVVWMCVGEWRIEGKSAWEVGAATDPLRAAIRLLEQVCDGGTCTHCRRPTGVSDDFTQAMPMEEHVCWFQYDPELKTFRRGCEGDTPVRPPAKGRKK